jgi:hypothetical protein
MEIIKPRGYKYLNDASGRDPKDVLVANETITKSSIIIRDELLYEYYLFKNYDEFNAVYPINTTHCCHEVIIGGLPQKIKFDIDCTSKYEGGVFGGTIDDYMRCENIKSTINKFAIDYIGNTSCVHIIDSSGIIYDSTGDKCYKFSYHYVINILVPNVGTAKCIAEYVRDQLTYPGAKELLDMNVYKSIQNFRTPYSAKKSRKLVPQDGHDRNKCMIGVYDEIPMLNIPPNSPLEKYIGSKPLTIQYGDINDDFAKEIIKQIPADKIRGWEYRRTVGNLLIFNRTPLAPTMCDICNRDHDNDNTMQLIMKLDGSIVKYCRREQGKSKVLLRANKSIPKFVFYANRMYKQLDIAAKCNFENKFIYSDKDMLGIDKMNIGDNPRTMYIRANMKMGKTQIMIDYLRKYEHVVVISFRCAFTNDKMAHLRKYGFKSYSDIEGEIDLRYTRRVIIQLESLHRLSTHVVPDLVIMDESESIFDQFNSDTIRDINTTHAMFEWIVTGCTSLLALDANLDQRTTEIIRYYRGTTGEIFVNNIYQNFTGDIIKPVSKKILNSKIIAAVKAGKNIIIPTNNKRYADSICTSIASAVPGCKILYISGNTPEETKKEIFSDVNNYWKQYQVVIYTPTCSAGVSFTEEHFDAVYAYFTNCSTSVETSRQMLYRVRNVASKTYYVCIKEVPKPALAANINDLEKVFTNINYLRSNNVGIDCRYKFGPDGNYEFVKDGIYKIWLWNKFAQMQSQCYFIQRFCEQSAATGARFDVSEYDKEDAGTIANVDKLFKSAELLIDDVHCTSVAAAEDVEPEIYKQIVTTGIKNREQNAIVKRYQLRKKYKYPAPKPITKAFVQTYGDKKTQAIHKNLLEILQSTNYNVSIDNIKRYEDSIKNRPKNLNSKILPTKSAQHLMAIKLLTICGFNGIMDTREINKDVIYNNIVANKQYIVDNSGELKALYNKNIPAEKCWDALKQPLSYINSILDMMYGCKILMKSTNIRDLYLIKHSHIGKSFALDDTPDKPHIKPNWLCESNVI